MLNFLNRHVLIFLIVIILFASFLRIYSLASNPPSLTWDEVAWGYNAYSLGIDGKDEFGKFLPISYLESFGDFKPPVYAYLDILPIKIFGLNEFATRFPSALFGVLTVLVTFFLVRRIFFDSSSKIPPRSVNLIALISALLLAISPWHILLSRGAFEANVATFFIVTGIWAFLAGVQDKKWYLLISAVCFAISMYTFNTSRVFCPLIVIILAFAFRKQLYKVRAQTITAAIVGFLIILPAVPFLLSDQASLRFKEVNIFTEKSVVTSSNEKIANDDNSLFSKIINNRRVGYALLFGKHYFDNLSANFLFVEGDGNPKFSTRSNGQMYLFEIAFLIAGILFLFRKREGNWWLIPVWLLVGIIPAATARETPHALRIETTLPTFQILSAYGAYHLYKLVSGIKYKVLSVNLGKIFAICYLLFAIFCFVKFYHDYFYQYPYQYSSEWQYGYKQAINYFEKNSNYYDKVIFTEELGRPYAFTLFYTKYNPEEFRSQAHVERDVFGFVHVRNFGKYIFAQDVVKSIDPAKNYLYVDMPDNIPQGASIVAEFKNMSGKVSLAAYTY